MLSRRESRAVSSVEETGNKEEKKPDKEAHKSEGLETIEPLGLRRAEIQRSADRFFLSRKKKADETSPSSTHLTRERTWAPLAAVESRPESLSRTDR